MNKLLLIVEDETAIRNALAIDLEHKGKYQCAMASDHQEALQMLQNGLLPQVILVDIMMPSSPEAGLHLIKDLKTQKQWEWIPVIVLSARSQSETILEALRQGAIDYLIKPYDPLELLNRVDRAYHLFEKKASSKKYAPPPKSSQLDQRWYELHTEVMQMSLLYWEVTTHKTKIDLAETSGIWSSYIDAKGTYRTKTLDRYLHLHTLPKRPNTHQVFQTAYFALKQFPVDEILRPQLQACLDELETLNRNREN